MVFENAHEDEPTPFVAVEKEILAKYPENCGDRIKVT